MLEIYNENLRDLLTEGGGGRLDILSTQASGCNVPGAMQVDGVQPRGGAECQRGPWVV